MGGGKGRNMKKIFASIALLALAFTATPALAHNDGGSHDSRGKSGFGQVASFFHKKNVVGTNRFTISGNVVSSTTTQFVVTVDKSWGSTVAANTNATVVVNSNTKIYGDEKTVLAIGDIKAGDKVAVFGTKDSNNVLTAVYVRRIDTRVAVGKVTAINGSAVTITNSVTGQTQTVTVDANTKVKIDGETKTAADISVGDAGWVKFKTATGQLVAKVVKLFR